MPERIIHPSAEPETVEPLSTREIGESEYEDLKTLLEELEGDWKGTIAELTCKGGPGDERNEVVEYTVRIEKAYYRQGRLLSHSSWHLGAD